MEQSRARPERDGGAAGSTMALTPPSSPSAAPPPPLSPTSPTSTSNVDADSPPSSSAASSTPLRRRLFALGGLFQKVAASPLSPRRSSQAPLKHVASECWGLEDNNEDHHDDDDELDVSALSPEEDELFAPAAVGEEEFLVSSLLLPVSSPPEWHQLPAHILELIVESALLPENELTTPWKERAVSFF